MEKIYGIVTTNLCVIQKWFVLDSIKLFKLQSTANMFDHIYL